MSIEIIKEDIKLEELIGDQESQVLVEKEIYVNTGTSQIEKLVWVDPKVDILSSKILEDRILVNGLVKFNILYKDLEGQLHTLEEQSDFKEEIEIGGVSEGMTLDIEAKIEYLEEELEENKILLRIVINLNGKVLETKTLEMIKEIEGEEDLQSLKKEVGYKEVFGRQVSYEQVKDSIALDESKPPMERVIKFSAKAKEVENVVSEDRVIVSGEILVSMIYLSQGGVYTIKESLPFNHFIDMDGVYRDLENKLKLRIKDGSYEVSEDDFGDLKKVDVNFNVEIDSKVYKNTSRNLIIDIYSTREYIILEQEEIRLKENMENMNYEENKSFDVDIDAKEILDIEVYENIVDKRYMDGEIIIDGVLNTNIYYLEKTSGEISMLREYFPFKSAFPIDEIHEDSIIELNCSLNDLNYILKNDSLTIENNISYDISLNKDRIIYCIKDIEQTGEVIDKKNKASISIYIVQKGDILWDVAKRYNTTRQEIFVANNLDRDYQLKLGDKIIIEKKLDLEL